ncbi:MAG: hypothetical protein HY830_14865 [Actinobacteria bacterium]|nr:hypothetical protein [Actinomycetota bacterium]
MKIRKTLAALGLVAVLSTTAACGAAATGTSSGSSTTTTSSTSSDTSSDTSAAAAGSNAAAAGPNAVDVSSVTTEEQLVALVQEAYGDASLGLHRGHQPVESVLDEVLGISHDELHVRMEEQGQNLAAVANDLGIDPQTLVDALVESWSPAIDTLLANGTITQDEADAYRAALEEAFTFRVTWDGQAATPTFSGLEA